MILYPLHEGDRVAGYLPNIPEAGICMLATTSIGAIWSSCSPDFGKKGVLEIMSATLATNLDAKPTFNY